jgi:ankyrin repeat protein
MSASDVFETIQRGDLEGLKQVLSLDPATAAARNAAGVSALVLARYADRADMVQVLLAAAPPLDVFEASMLGPVERLQAILTAEPGSLRAWSPDGFTPLHLAAAFGPPPAVVVLLDAGADPSLAAQNITRSTPLHAAVTAGRDDVVALLLGRGADANARQVGGFTPLHAASRQGNMALVEMLLAHGADPAAASDDGRDAGAFAAGNGHASVAERLRR